MDIVEELRKEEQNQRELERSVQVLLSNPHGKKFIAYLFDSFMVGESAPIGLDDRQLVDFTAFLRAGNSIYKLCLSAAPELTGQLISEMFKEKQKNVQTQATNGSDTGTRI